MYSSEEKNTREYWLIYKCISHCISRLVPRLTNYEQPSYFCVFPQGWRRWFVPAASSRPITFSNTALRHPVRMPNRVHHLARSSHLTNRPTKAHYHVTVRPHSMSSTRPLHGFTIPQQPTATNQQQQRQTTTHNDKRQTTTNTRANKSRHLVMPFSHSAGPAVRQSGPHSVSRRRSQSVNFTFSHTASQSASHQSCHL